MTVMHSHMTTHLVEAMQVEARELASRPATPRPDRRRHRLALHLSRRGHGRAHVVRPA